jgi:peroxiredoxin
MLLLMASGCGPGKAPNFDVVNSEDTSDHLTLANLKGKVVVLDFWATWCGPCRIAIPQLEQLVHEYKGKNVEFVGISTDPSSKVAEFREANDVNYPMYLDTDYEAMKGFGVENIPHIFILDKKGAIVYSEEGAPLNEQEIRSEIDSSLNG